MVTFADILGSKLPDSAGEDSFSLLRLFKGEDKPVRENAVSCSIRGVPGLRQGDWKLILAAGSGRGTKGGDGQPVQLYNLAEDLGEKKNLATEQSERVAEMKVLMEKLITEGRSTPGAPQKNDVNARRYAQKGAPPKETQKSAK